MLIGDKMRLKTILKEKIFHPLYKVSNILTFTMLFATAIILYTVGKDTDTAITIMFLSAFFIIFVKMENQETRLRNLEGD